ncbi:Ig-like domain-containing protein [Viridibacillus arvi]|uniref:Ig-like domain-containing protein n=1 Tax=Viridibacillus arvi TaxID=263475 RepID=UPI003D28C6CC
MYTSKWVRKWVAPIGMASLLAFSQLPGQLSTVNAAENTSATVQVPAKDISYKNVLNSTAAFLLQQVPNPSFGDEDYVTDFARASVPVPSKYYETYYNNLVKEVSSKKGKISEDVGKYSKVIIALTAINKDPRNVGGYDLVKSMYDTYLATEEAKKLTNGHKFHFLNAIDTKNYDLSTESKYAEITRTKLVNDLVKDQFEDGSFAWALAYGSDKDSTSMTATTLAPYTKDEKVKAAVEKANDYLGEELGEQAGFYSEWAKGDSPETVSQFIINLTSNQTNPKTDPRFIKGDGNWVVSNLVSFVDSTTGGLKSGLSLKIPNLMSTDQGLRALAAYDRFENEKNRIYDMSDAAESIKFYAVDIAAPVVESIGDSATVVKGKATANATVYIYNNNNLLNKVKADTKGNFSLTIKKQAAGSNIIAISENAEGVRSNNASLVVKDITSPIAATANIVSDQTTSVKGKAEAGSKVTIYNGSKLLASTTASTKGTYSLTIKKQKANSTLKIYVTDAAKNKSKAYTLKVVDKTAPKAPSVKKVTKSTTKVTGTAEKGAKVYVLKGKTSIGKGTVNSKGQFTVKIKNQKANTKLTVYAKDKAGNKSNATKVTVKTK